MPLLRLLRQRWLPRFRHTERLCSHKLLEVVAAVARKPTPRRLLLSGVQKCGLPRPRAAIARVTGLAGKKTGRRPIATSLSEGCQGQRSIATKLRLSVPHRRLTVTTPLAWQQVEV